MIPCLVFGIMFIFEIICVPSIFLGLSLTTVTLIWILASAVYTVVIILWHKKKRSERPEGLFPPGKESVPYVVLAICLIVFQMFLVCFFEHRDDDDAMYLGSSMAAYETNEMFVYSPYTGAETGVLNPDNRDYLLSPLPMMWAGISKITHIHPAVLEHTVMPPIIVLFAYYLVGLLGLALFKDKRYAWMFVCLASLLNMLCNYSSRMPGVFLLFRAWQGKAVFAALMIPAMLLYFIRFLKDEGGAAELFITAGAGCLSSFTAVIIMAYMIGLFAVIAFFALKEKKKCLKILPALVPEIILIPVYFFIR